MILYMIYILLVITYKSSNIFLSKDNCRHMNKSVQIQIKTINNDKFDTIFGSIYAHSYTIKGE